MKKGALIFVFHSHLPYVRRAGTWPHGEDILHEAIVGSYLPLLTALYDLVEEGYHPRVTMSLTPILLEQLADRDILNHLRIYIEQRVRAATADERRYDETGNAVLRDLARWYAKWYLDQLRAFDERFGGDLVGAFRRLQDLGVVDLITCSATHAYLPLMSRDSTIQAQLELGVKDHEKRLNHRPSGIWLAECAYRPAYFAGDDQRYKPGIEEFLDGLNLCYFFSETYAVEGGALSGKAAGDVVGPYGSMPQRAWVHLPQSEFTGKHSVMRPYYVGRSKVAVFAREPRTGGQVWSEVMGYPGDFNYREFHRRDAVSGMKYYRVTDPSENLGTKLPYQPEVAHGRALEHARHFADMLRQVAHEFNAETGKVASVVSAYDTELFGHWWFEGLVWLKEVLRLLEQGDGEVFSCTAKEYLANYPPDEALALPESSWGAGGGHYTWRNAENEWMWPLIENAERKMEKLVEAYPNAEGEWLRLLNQTARELLLLESSDWPFLISTEQAVGYAIQRFQLHLDRFDRLALILDDGRYSLSDLAWLGEIEYEDNPFPFVDYRSFAAREGAVKPPA